MNSETKNIKAIMILEIVGTPPEHLTNTLNKLIDNMGKEKDVEVIKKKVMDVVEMKNQKGFFTTFAEIEIEVNEMLQIAALMFKYMPSNVMIIEPELIALSNNQWGEILSELTRRLHGYDEVARVLQMENAQLKRELKSILNKNTAQNKTNTSKEDIKYLGVIGDEKKKSKKKKSKKT